MFFSQSYEKCLRFLKLHLFFRKHASLVEINKQVMDALQMYHSLMKETPAYGYASKASTNPAMYAPGNPVMSHPAAMPTMSSQVAVALLKT